jgi:pimeloyl-ACP methyl ester carboxylesterase
MLTEPFRRLLRSSALVLVTALGTPACVAAQVPDSLWISMRGDVRANGETYVLLSGVLGGLAGYRGIERRLLLLGHRVVIIDPYLMSIDSADVSFDALARRVNAQLDLRGVRAARVVGHAHGGGVALRLASNWPARVSELFLLNVGALAGNHSPVFSSSMRLAMLVAHVPGGKSFVRRRIVARIRENTGKSEWLDDAAAHAYTDTPLAYMGAVVGLATRLGQSEEPERLAPVIARVKVPVTMLIGALKCPASPSAEEIAALESLGAFVRVVKIEGTCHFPHEEAPEVVVNYLTHRLAAAQ